MVGFGTVMLDACRTNPFLPKMQGRKLSRAVDRGFSRVEPSDNVLVAYAARESTTATDGSGRSRPFTQSLLKNIETPGLEITFMFRNVRDDVMASTRREQQPFVYGSLSKEMIYLKPQGATPPAGKAGSLMQQRCPAGNSDGPKTANIAPPVTPPGRRPACRIRRV
ncbi:caspase family protein [Bradyrhizobium cenepequi]